MKGTTTQCHYFCDADFGCDHCLPAGLAAGPEVAEDSSSNKRAAVARMPMGSTHIPWIADTGAAQDLLSRDDAQPEPDSSHPMKFRLRMVVSLGQNKLT